ncbi:MAG: transcription elongation factor GreA [Candidatus Pacebacteria bacterium]|nr:transcription elongation factor GreA [Candidatus Paceibacterota bacterium]
MEIEKEYLTKKKYEELGGELEWLKTTRRQELAGRLKEALSLGDLSENAEYHQAREDQANAEKRIREIETILRNVAIVEGSSFDKIAVGATVTIQPKGKKDKVQYSIVGSQEADMAKNKISVASPLVQAMLGKKTGDSFFFESPQGIKNYKIIEIK